MLLPPLPNMRPKFGRNPGIGHVCRARLGSVRVRLLVTMSAGFWSGPEVSLCFPMRYWSCGRRGHPPVLRDVPGVRRVCTLLRVHVTACARLGSCLATTRQLALGGLKFAGVRFLLCRLLVRERGYSLERWRTAVRGSVGVASRRHAREVA